MNEWVAVNRSIPCPICLKTDWCLLHIDGKKVICPRIKSNVRLGEAGFLHKVHDNGLKNSTKPNKRTSNLCVNWFNIQKLYRRKLKKKGNAHVLLKQLGLKNLESLTRFGLGWDGDAWTYPCYDGGKNIVGIMRRFEDGRKLFVSRSRPGLFLPKMNSFEGNVFICEGMSDSASMIDLGFRAIGRANCQTGIQYIKQLLHHHRNAVKQVTIVGDNDLDNVQGNVGKGGAMKLARELYGGNQLIACLEIPDEFKDIRQWITEGGAGTVEIKERSRRL